MDVQELCTNLAIRMRELEGDKVPNEERYGLLFDAIQDEALAAGVNIGALIADIAPAPSARKFTVNLVEKVYYSVDVEATDEDEATALATEQWAQSADPTHDFCGSGNGVEAYSVEEGNNCQML